MLKIKRLICCLIAGLLAGAPLMPAHAGLVGTNDLIAEQSLAADRQLVIDTLEREDVGRMLALHGVEPGEAEKRVAALSNAEVRQLAEEFKELPAAGDVVEVLVIGALVLVILELVGVTDIFTAF